MSVFHRFHKNIFLFNTFDICIALRNHTIISFNVIFYNIIAIKVNRAAAEENEFSDTLNTSKK